MLVPAKEIEMGRISQNSPGVTCTYGLKFEGFDYFP